MCISLTDCADDKMGCIFVTQAEKLVAYFPDLISDLRDTSRVGLKSLRHKLVTGRVQEATSGSQESWVVGWRGKFEFETLRDKVFL